MEKDVLFVMIVILTIVFNVIKAVRKKEQAARKDVTVAPPVSASGESTDFEEIWRKFTEETGSRRVQTVTQEKQEGETLETIIPLGGSLETIEEYEWKPPVYSTSSLSSEVFDVTPATISQEEQDSKPARESKQAEPWTEGSHFNLRRAIIFSAILEKPYV
jgi:hypothetical protein